MGGKRNCEQHLQDPEHDVHDCLPLPGRHVEGATPGSISNHKIAPVAMKYRTVHEGPAVVQCGAVDIDCLLHRRRRGVTGLEEERRHPRHREQVRVRVEPPVRDDDVLDSLERLLWLPSVVYGR